MHTCAYGTHSYTHDHIHQLAHKFTQKHTHNTLTHKHMSVAPSEGMPLWFICLHCTHVFWVADWECTPMYVLSKQKLQWLLHSGRFILTADSSSELWASAHPSVRRLSHSESQGGDGAWEWAYWVIYSEDIESKRASMLGQRQWILNRKVKILTVETLSPCHWG